MTRLGLADRSGTTPAMLSRCGGTTEVVPSRTARPTMSSAGGSAYDTDRKYDILRPRNTNRHNRCERANIMICMNDIKYSIVMSAPEVCAYRAVRLTYDLRRKAHTHGVTGLIGGGRVVIPKRGTADPEGGKSVSDTAGHGGFGSRTGVSSTN